MPGTGTEPGNPGTTAAAPLPNVQTPPGMLACAHTDLHSICLLGIPAAAAVVAVVVAVYSSAPYQGQGDKLHTGQKLPATKYVNIYPTTMK
jgi:hypothetical protein